MPPKAKKQKLDNEYKKENVEIKGTTSVDEKAEMNFVRKASSSRYWVGVHVSAAAGPKNAVVNAHDLGCNSFALFLKNQRTWNYTALTQKSIDEFKSFMKQYNYDYKQVLPHGSYLINLGNPDKEKRLKSYNAFLDDLKRCELLEIELYNFHPGSTVGECSIDESINFIAESINMAIKETSKVVVVLENMAGQGNTVGRKFEELAKIISKIDDKNRIGICIDTCHAFAAGYDLRTEESFNKVFKKFEDIVGFQYLKALHLNDSKGELGDNKDRHENLGKGKLGIQCFKCIMNDNRFENIPLIIETPAPANDLSIYKKEVDLLYSLKNDQDS